MKTNPKAKKIGHIRYLNEMVNQMWKADKSGGLKIARDINLELKNLVRQDIRPSLNYSVEIKRYMEYVKGVYNS